MNKCRFCRKDFIDVGLHPEETLMVPDCDCQKVTITIDRKMLANLMNYANNGIVYSLLCDMLVNGKEDDNMMKVIGREPEIAMLDRTFRSSQNSLFLII